MPKGGLYVEGLRETVKALEQAGVEVDELKDVMATISTEAANTMQGFIPARSGKLRSSARGNKAKGNATVTIGRASVQYAGPILYGWPARGISSSKAVERTDAVMETRAPILLEEGFTRILDRLGL